mgnify:CR=1 FL=1
MPRQRAGKGRTTTVPGGWQEAVANEDDMLELKLRDPSDIRIVTVSRSGTIESIALAYYFQVSYILWGRDVSVLQSEWPSDWAQMFCEPPW